MSHHRCDNIYTTWQLLQKLQPLPFLRNKVNQIQIHHPSIQGLVDTDMESFFLKVLVLIQKAETILLVEVNSLRSVVRIDNHKAAPRLVVGMDKSGNQVINNLAPQMQAAPLKLPVNAQTSNQQRRICPRMFCVRDLALQAVPRGFRNHRRFDAVVGQSKRARNLRSVRIRHRDVALSQQLRRIQVGVVLEEIVKILVAAAERGQLSILVDGVNRAVRC